MTGGEPEVLAPHFVNESGGWVLQRETVTNHSDSANQPIPRDSVGTGSTSPRVLLVGASVRWAAQSARKAGFSVVGMDLFGDTDTLATCDDFYRISPEVASEIGRLRQQIDTVAEWHQARPRLVGGLGALSVEASALKSSPDALGRLCDGLAVSVPTTLNKIPAADSSFDQTAGTPVSNPFGPQRWLVKQNQSCGGLGVRLWNRFDVESHQAIESGHASVQSFIPGHCYGLVAIASEEGTRLLGMTRSLRQRIGLRPFVYSGSLGPCWDPNFPITAMTELSCRVASEYSLRGLFNLDFIHDRKGQWWLLELNARPSGSCEVIERFAWHSGQLSRSESLMGLHIAAVDRQTLALDGIGPFMPNGSDSLYLKQIVYARRAGRFNTPKDVHGIADVPGDQDHIEVGHPIATTISSLERNGEPLSKAMRANQRRLRGMVKPGRQFG